MSILTTTDVSPSNTERRRPTSSGLDAFRINPFRVLRVPVSVATEQAVWEAERLIARVRVGVEPKTPDPIPFLPKVDEIEIQKAAQIIEEPLQRLIHQTLYFDLDADPRGEALATALSASDLAALEAYMRVDEAELGLPDPETTDEGEDMEAVMRGRMVPLVAHRLNQANLRLLLAFSALHGALGARAAARGVFTGTLTFEDVEGRSVARDPHRSLEQSGGSDDARWQALLADGIARWTALLADPWLETRILHQVEELGDELVSEADVETIVEAVRSTLTDLVVGEMKHAMMQGHPDRVRLLAAVVSDAGLEARHWGVALRPLRNLFRSEIQELTSLLGEGTDVSLPDVKLYLAQLSALASRWAVLDEGGALGLAVLIDEAVLQAFEHARHARGIGKPPPELEDVLLSMRAIARTPSLIERIDSFIALTRDYGAGLCHFCQERPISLSHCGALTAKVQTHVEYHFNSRTIHYRIGGQPVARCEACADFHQELHRLGQITFATILVAGFAALALWDERVGVPTFGLAALVLVLAGAGAYVARRLGSTLGKEPYERDYHDWGGSHGALRLAQEGLYGPKFEMQKDAWSYIEQNGVQSGHDRGSLTIGCGIALAVGATIAITMLRGCGL